MVVFMPALVLSGRSVWLGSGLEEVGSLDVEVV
jgi:hypothetical protein